MSEEGEDYKGNNKPLRGLVFKTIFQIIGRRLIVSVYLSLSLFVLSSFGTKFTFTSSDVKVNSSQLNDACDQGLTVETCCTRKNKILSQSFVCLFV